MSNLIGKVSLFVVILSLSGGQQAAYAEDALSKADAAVANILFDYDGASEFASYAINENGFVDITFAKNVPEKLYGEILTKLQNHPDINGVLSGKGGPPCKLF